MNKNTVIDYIDNESLYNEFFTPLFRYLFFRVKDYDIANDLVQTSFLKFLNQDLKIKDKNYATKLLFTIARNTLIDYWRVENKKYHIDIDEVGDIKSEDKNPEEIAILKEDTMLVGKILENLSEVEREIVSMRLSGDIPYETIAQTVGMSVVNSRKIYSRALQKVEAFLKNNNQL